nr:MAG TPA: hypothetical protein [Caudoviricetes sp.]
MNINNKVSIRNKIISNNNKSRTHHFNTPVRVIIPLQTKRHTAYFSRIHGYFISFQSGYTIYTIHYCYNYTIYLLTF